MNRAEAKIAVRDRVLANFMNIVIGEGTGDDYLAALKDADAQVEAALKARLGD